MFSRSVQELITKRISTRSFSKKILPEQKTITALQSYCDNLSPSPFGDKGKFIVIDAAGIDTLGMIKDPPAFIIGTIAQNERCYESFGYLFEHVLLKTTELGLSTCWLGYFNLPETLISQYKNEKTVMPAISPIGYGSKSLISKDFIVRSVLRSSRRKQFSELFFNRDFSSPLERESAGNYSLPLEMVRLAPSAGNRQPWRIVIENDMAHFFIDMSRVPVHYRQKKLHLLDIGIAIAHFELSCHEQKIRGHYISIKPESRPATHADYSYSISWKGL